MPAASSVQVTLALLLVISSVLGVQAQPSFLHLSDIHLNTLYSIYGNTSYNCVLNTSRALPGKMAAHAELPLSEMGTMFCDPPVVLVQAALGFMANLSTAPEFIIMTGDFSMHDLVYEADVLDSLTTATWLLGEAFAGLPVIPTLGNDDCSPDYNMPLPPLGAAWLAAVWGVWSPWLSRYANASDTFLYGGYYEACPQPGLCVLALNTIYYSTTVNDSAVADPAGQFAWLQARLAAARAGGWAVYVIGHIPPVVAVFQNAFLWMPQYADAYAQLVTAYADVVAAQLFGHTHHDEFRLVWRPDAPVAPLLIGGSVSMIFGNNPSFRTISYDPARGYALLRYVEYYVDFAAGSLVWAPEYDFVGAYGIAANISAASLQQLYRLLATSEAQLAAYANRTYAQAPQAPLTRLQQLCALAARSLPAYGDCMRTGVLPLLGVPPSRPVLALWQAALLGCGALAVCLALTGATVALVRRRTRRGFTPINDSL